MLISFTFFLYFVIKIIKKKIADRFQIFCANRAYLCNLLYYFKLIYLPSYPEKKKKKKNWNLVFFLNFKLTIKKTI